MKKQSYGFTLLEVVMVLFIITLVLGGVLAPLSSQVEGEERKKTAQLLEDIKASLLGYAIIHGHFPCPDCPDDSTANCGVVNTALGSGAINDGIEDGTDDPVTTASNDRNTVPFERCATTTGNLPWVTLGVPEYDAWENHFAYRVTEEFADDIDGTGEMNCMLTDGVSFQICSDGNMDIKDDPGAGGNNIADKLVAVVVSFGKNAGNAGNPASVYEQENQNGTVTFIDRDYGRDGANEFDDLLIWIPAPSLMYQMVRAERLP